MPPAQTPGRSKQDYQTPPRFLQAVCRRLGINRFQLDVAAATGQEVGRTWWTPEDDALQQSWQGEGWGWLNPPFAHIAPWVQKAYQESQQGASIAVLIPAGVGANWWRDWVHQKCYAILLNGRLTFVGETSPYPKDCCLLLYTPKISPGYEVWDWRRAIVGVEAAE